MSDTFAPAKTVAGVEIPEGWYVHEAGQDRAHMMWFAILLNFDDVLANIAHPRHAVGVECDTIEAALQMAVDKIAAGKNEMLADIVDD